MRMSTAVGANRESSTWRTSVLKAFHEETDFQVLKRQKYAAALQTQNEYTEYFSVSMFFLNKFMKDILDGVLAPNVSLFTLSEPHSSLKVGQTLCQIADENDQTRLQELNRATNLTTLSINFDKADLEELPEGPQKFRVFSHTGVERQVTLDSSKVKFKRRDKWTIADVVQYIIRPEITAPDSKYRLYVDKIRTVNKHYVSQPFQGIYLIATRNTSFMTLMKSLKKSFSLKGIPDFDAFVFMDIFSTDMRSLENVSLPGKWSNKARLEYNKIISTKLHSAISSFDDRYIFINDWLKPDVLERMWTAWEIYGAFACEKKFDVITIEFEQMQDVWKGEGSTMFTVIENMDPSRLGYSSFEDYKVIREFASIENGFNQMRKKIKEKFTKWAAIEAENQVKYFYSIKAQDTYYKLSDLLILTGQFMTRQGELTVAASYIGEALQIYETYEMEKLVREKDEDDLEDLHSPKFVHEILTGLVTARSNLAKILSLQTQYERALENIQAAKDAAKLLKKEKDAYLIDIELVEAEIQSREEHIREAIRCYTNVELAWKSQPSKSERIADLDYKIGTELRKLQDYNEAQKWFELATIRHQKYLTTHNLPNDILMADIYSAVGDSFSKQKFLDEAIKHYELANNIYREVIGDCNPSVGKLYLYLGNCFARKGQFQVALLNFQKSIEIYGEYYGATSVEIAAVYNASGLVYQILQNFELAEENFRSAVNVMRNIIDEDSVRKKLLSIAAYEVNLGETLKVQKKFEEAREAFMDALQIREQELGPEAEETLKIYDCMNFY